MQKDRVAKFGKLVMTADQKFKSLIALGRIINGLLGQEVPEDELKIGTNHFVNPA